MIKWKNFFHITISLAIFLFPQLCNAQTIQQTMKEVFGNDYKGYQWLNYPINNFGIGTAYKGNKGKIDKRNFLCATFSCLGKPVPKEETQLLHLGNPPDDAYADVGCGGLLDTKIAQKKDTVLNAVLPQIFGIIGINFSAGKSGKMTAEIKSATMCARQLQQQKMVDYINGLTVDKFGMKRALDQGKLVLVVGDVVIKTMTITVKADSNLKVGIDGKLKGQPEKLFGENANFGVKVSREGESDYSLTITEPVIVGLLAISERTLGKGSPERQGAISPWKGWYPVTAPLPRTQRSYMPPKHNRKK
jgi:hypothetical protein